MKKTVQILTLMLALLMICASFALAQDGIRYTDTIAWNAEYDVVVIGFGGSGAATAITAADCGAKVLLVEKAPEGHEGGNTRYAAQCVLTISEKEPALKYFDTLRGPYDQSDEIIEVFVDKCIEMDEWLESLGAEVTLITYPGAIPEYDYEGSETMFSSQVDGEMFSSKFWKLLRDNVMKRAENIDVWFDAPGKELIQDPMSKTIVGVKVEKDGELVNVRAKNGVVLCTGGFEANLNMVRNYLNLPEMYPMGGTYNTGDGILMAQAVGADLWHMGAYNGVYLNMKVEGSGSVCNTQIRGKGNLGSRSAIMVGSDATRFIDESSELKHGYTYFHGRWINTPVPVPAYVVFDEAARLGGAIYKGFSADNSDEVEKGWIVKADTIAELAEKLGLDPQALCNEVETYNKYCAEGEDPACGRPTEMLQPITDGPYYAMELVPSVVNTQGGPRRNENAEVLDTFGNPIPHLYSAGELGSIFPNIYQGAGNLAECAAFGRIAGENAAKEKPEIPELSFTAVEKDLREFAETEKEIELADNEYIGEGTGIGGTLTVKVTMNGDAIASVEILSHTETPVISDRAIDEMPQRIVEAQSADVDTVSGATLTSNAIKAAVEQALANR